MSAIDELRRKLDERGVEWTEGIARPELTQVRIDGKVVKFHPWQPNTLKVSLFDITPEQAIAATLGVTDAKPTQAESSGTLTAEKVRELMEENSRQYPSPTDPYVWLTEYDWQAIADELNATLGSCNCSNNCTNSERTGTCLPHFWTHDGTLHVEATRMPTRIVVCEGGTCEFVPKRELDASEYENAKLRELVKALLTCATDGDCDECRLNGATPWHVGKAQLCDGVWDRMHELGVEVDR